LPQQYPKQTEIALAFLQRLAEVKEPSVEEPDVGDRCATKLH